LTTPTPRIAILLSTYNGARFLPEQLGSFLAQTERDWILLWRDDGSVDTTLGIMEAFAADIGSDRCRRIDTPGRLGVAGNFYALIQAAQKLALPVAFSDQDDVWLPEKLSRALSALGTETGPAMYCSRQMLVDDELVPIGVSAPVTRPPSFAAALTQNIATGCTVVLDPAAVSLVAASIPPKGPLHDWWSYLIVTGAGGRVIVDPEPTMLYRQHAANLIGAPASQRRRALAALRRGPKAYIAMMRANIAALKNVPVLTPEARRTVNALNAALRGGAVARLRVLSLPGLHRQTPLETALFRLWFLRG